MMSNLIDALKEIGVDEVVSCPGGRSANLLNQIVDSKKFKIETFYDERSAGFYALGRSVESEKPVVLLTTSGSAVANVYPSLLEAKLSEKGQLIYISADRPEEFEKTGAPQTITQNDIFNRNGIKTITLSDEVKDYDFRELSYPAHINFHAKDPNALRKKPIEVRYESLIIIGSLRKGEKESVLKELKEYQGALVLEPLSNLKASDFPKATVLKFADSFLNKVRIESFREVIRIGGVPIIKTWRAAHAHASVFYWDDYDHQGTIGASGLSLSEIAERTADCQNNTELTDRVNRHIEIVESLLEERTQSEISRMRALTKLIPEGSRVFLGNSLPIRDWEYVDYEKYVNLGQRGVNGIDGSLAYFLGQLDLEVENWIVLGDLTTLYNLNDFQVLKNLKDYKIRIVVVNNSGGRIFDKIFDKNKEFFINEQKVMFSKVALLWEVPYAKTGSSIEKSQHIMCELVVDPKESLDFYNELEEVIL